MQLSDAEESLLWDYPMVIDYILGSTLQNVKQNKNGFIHFFWSYRIKVDVGETKSKGYFLRCPK